MFNADDVIIDTLNDTEGEPTDPSADESVEDKMARLEETNKKLFERAKKAEGFVRSPDGNWVKTQPKILPTPQKPKVDDEIVNDVKELKLIEKKRQFGYKHSLSPEETDTLFRFAGDNDPQDALKDPFFQAGLAESRKAQRVQDAIPSSTNRSTKVEGKTFSEMTTEERAKNWSKITKR